MDRTITLAVLASGAGTTLQNLIEQIASGGLDARIGVVVVSRRDIAAIERARAARLQLHIVERGSFSDCTSFSTKVFDLIDDAGADLVVMAGWLCLTEIPWRYASRVMNIHPALLPSFGGEGMFGERVHRAVLEHGCKVSGCTVHFVDEGYDTGPIILQRCCEIREDDSPRTLAARVFEEEKRALPEAIRMFAQGRLVIDGKRVRVRGG